MSENKTVDFQRKRREIEATTENDARLWTVEDALLSMTEAVEDLPEDRKPDKAVILTFEADDDGYFSRWRLAGLTVSEAIGLVERWKFDILEELSEEGAVE